MPGGDEILIPFEQRDAIFELLQSLFEALPELVVHLSSFRKLQRPKQWNLLTGLWSTAPVHGRVKRDGPGVSGAV
ncbi:MULTISPECIES: hypothetical protein [unclassified Bradyrhizobium]|uniref:hypothetical protein n=1 Tax=unclassified Bradyrhizobium TaxID=2631580 RepID=UPI0015C7802D|nr:MULTISPECIES: hypothetical protein [unclassified Bradyrhizobium]MBB4257458.1 hypothetical protein [Bradyrhizobium sp. CIR3A]MBB4362048.1 hypothetical protein [Bradyrhizobium sp. CIR18]NYG45031.1 hypothetical protein [Bradyrhizobium sp. IAR9]